MISKKPKASPNHWAETAKELVTPIELIINSSDIKDELRLKIKLALQRAYRSGYRQGMTYGDRRESE